MLVVKWITLGKVYEFIPFHFASLIWKKNTIILFWCKNTHERVFIALQFQHFEWCFFFFADVTKGKRKQPLTSSTKFQGPLIWIWLWSILLDINIAFMWKASTLLPPLGYSFVYVRNFSSKWAIKYTFECLISHITFVDPALIVL